MKPLLTYRGLVYPWHCDHMGHMNVMWYVGKFDEGTWNLLAAIGITPTYLRETRNRTVAVQQNITYKRELLAGAVVEVWSHIVSLSERKIIFAHEMRDAENGEVCATCELTGVHTDYATRRASPFPRDIRARAQALLNADVG